MAQFQARITANNNNAYRWPGPYHVFYLGGIEIGHPGDWDPSDNREHSWLRWPNVTIPKGVTINSAYITLSKWYSTTLTIRTRIYGINQDNPAVYSTEANALARPLTSQYVDWDPSSSWTAYVDKTSPNIASIIQAIINRSGWNQGNAISLKVADRASDLYQYGPFCAATGYSSYSPQLTINYTYDFTEYSKTISSKALLNVTTPQTISAGADLYGKGITPVTHSKTVGAKAAIVPIIYGVLITKPGYNVLVEPDPRNFIFNSNYGTLKYHTSGTVALEIDVLGGTETGRETVTHSLGYIPYVEAFVELPVGGYEYLPSYGAGASTEWVVTYRITDTTIVFYAGEAGFLDENPTFNIKYFIFRNKLTFT